MINGQYKRGVSQSLLKCLNDQQMMYVLLEVHKGCCGHHLVEKLLAQKVVRAGYYWPTLIKDAMEYVKKCDKYQQHSNLHQAPPHEFVSIIPTQPFAKWGLDLLGPFPQGFVQVNGQAETANKVILNWLKKRLDEHLGSWADEGSLLALKSGNRAIEILDLSSGFSNHLVFGKEFRADTPDLHL
ncbi:uncharacterized protein LOC107633863 [Arachis ipaensis]|uniref:uncharacterized protein LOC107633863 n=1 Tax=Arachis ipaensis TaxID=130454 RepID=UPI0007AF0826|nr:uncharacterized protein LOC107633863 [Arachis ipaensis]XP_025640932.1 uncharacterized protein LOC112735621 [Arachis hypogaea]